MPDRCPSIEIVRGGGKHPLPAPLPVGVRVLPGRFWKGGVRQRRPAHAPLQIRFVLLAYLPEVVLERLLQGVRQHRQPILLTLTVTNHHLTTAKVEVFHPQLEPSSSLSPEP